MHLIAVSIAGQKVFEVDTARNSSRSIPFPKSMCTAYRERKRTDTVPQRHLAGRKFSAYSRAHDCLVTAFDAPSRVHFHQNFSKNFASFGLFAETEKKLPENNDDNQINFFPEGKTERRQRLKKERLARRGQSEPKEPRTVEVQAHEDITAFHLDPIEEYFITGGNLGGLTIWDVRTGSVLAHWELLHFGPITSLSVSTNRQCLLTCDADETIRLWKLSALLKTPDTASEEFNDDLKPTATQKFQFPKTRVQCMQFFPLSTELAVITTHDGFVRCIEVLTGTTVFEKQFGDTLTHVAFSPCHRYLLVSCGASLTFALNILNMQRIKEVNSNSTKKIIGYPLLFPDEKSTNSEDDIFLEIAKHRLQQKQAKQKQSLAEGNQPDLIRFFENDIVNISTHSNQPKKNTERLIIFAVDMSQQRLCALGTSGGLTQWEMCFSKNSLSAGTELRSDSTRMGNDEEREYYSPISSHRLLLDHSVDFACVVHEDSPTPTIHSTKPTESANTFIFDKTSAGIDVKDALRRPLTMREAKQVMHEKRTKRPMAEPEPIEPSKIFDQLEVESVPGMIPFAVTPDIDDILAVRLKLRNTVQILRDGIFQLERIANDLKEQKDVVAAEVALG